MKITGPGPGPSAEATGTAAKAGETKETGKAEQAFAEKLDRPDGPQLASSTGGAGSVSELSEIAAGLEAGRLTAAQAVDQLVQRIVTRQLGANAPTAVREQLETMLRQTLADDPVLVDKVRRLG